MTTAMVEREIKKGLATQNYPERPARQRYTSSANRKGSTLEQLAVTSRMLTELPLRRCLLLLVNLWSYINCFYGWLQVIEDEMMNALQ